MSQTGSNHKSIRMESRFEIGRNLGQIMTRTGSNFGSNRVESRNERGRLISQTGSYHESNMIKITNHVSNRVKS